MDKPQELIGLTAEELSVIWTSLGTYNISLQSLYNEIWRAILRKNGYQKGQTD